MDTLLASVKSFIALLVARTWIFTGHTRPVDAIFFAVAVHAIVTIAVGATAAGNRPTTVVVVALFARAALDCNASVSLACLARSTV